jgi:hypothetical protein
MLPNNFRFGREPLPVEFDWSFPGCPGMYSLPGSSGLETEFSGTEPTNCTIAEQIVALAPGDYEFTYSFQTAEVALGTGIHWQVVDAESNSVLASSSDLSSGALKEANLMFSVPPREGEVLLRFRLVYQREPGASRVSGSLLTQSTMIRKSPVS